MSAEDCLERARRYKKTVQQSMVFDGLFFRNLPKNQTSSRYDSANAEFGYKIKCGKWTNSFDGLSVNSAECASPQCSVEIGGRGDPDVARIDLRKLGSLIGMNLYADYAPVLPPHENPCHYVILAKDLPMEDFIARLKRLDDDIPKKRPSTPQETATFRAIASTHDAAMHLLRDVRSVDSGSCGIDP
jgi:hypothetical protein